MGILKIILVYILSVFAVAVVGYIFLPIAPLQRLFKKIKLITTIILFNLAIAIASKFIAVFIISWLCDKFSVKPALFMVIIPFVLTIRNNNNRIMLAEKGKSNVKYMLEEYGELDEYDQKLDIRIEYAHQIGDVTGLILGTIYFLRDATLF
jgi:hypothetical protein